MKFPFRRKRKPDDDDDLDESETVEDDSDAGVLAAPDDSDDEDGPNTEAAARDEDEDAARVEAEEAEGGGADDDGPDDGPDDGDEEDEDEDFDDDEDFDEDGGQGRPKGILILVSGATLVVVLGVFAGAWWFIGSGTPSPEVGKQTRSDGARVVIDIPPRNVAPLRAGLTPPDRSPASGPQPPVAATPRTEEGDSGHAETAASEPGATEAPDTAEPEARAAAADATGERGGSEDDRTAAASANLNTIAANAPQTGEGVVIAAVEPAAYAQVPRLAGVQALPEAPHSDLVEDGSDGPLPKIAEDGRTSWKAYARPFDAADERARIAIVLVGLGLSRAATEAAIARTPTAVNLAFDVYAKNLDDWVRAARQGGHEVLLTVPMEPDDFPATDPGPYALLASQDAPEKLRTLEFILSRFAGYVGVLALTDSKLAQDETQIRPVLEALRDRGLMYLGGADSGTKIAAAIGLASAPPYLVLDTSPTAVAIDTQLAALEGLARERKAAVAVASPYPSTLTRLAAWAETLEKKNIALAPVSALAVAGEAN